MPSLSLSQRLLVFILVPLIVVFALIGLLVHQQLNQSIPSLLEEAGRQQLEARGDETANWLNANRYWVHTLAKDPFLAGLSATEDTEKLRAWLRERHADVETIESFYFADSRGEFITHAGARGNVYQRDYFRELVREASVDSIFTNPITSAVSGLPISIIAEPVYDDAGRRVGLLGITLTMEEVSKTVAALALGEGSYGWMIDDSGMMIAHPHDEVRMQVRVAEADQKGFQGFSRHADTMLRGQSGSAEIKNMDGEPVVIMWSPVRGTPWSIGFSIPKENFTATSQELLKNISIAMSLALILLVIIITLVARQQLKPIQQIATGLHQIVDAHQADLTKKLPEGRRDEIGFLAREFNQFIDRIRHLVQEVQVVAQSLTANAENINHSGHSMQQHLGSQQQEASSIAAAMEQLSASMEEVASYAQQGSDTAVEGERKMEQGTGRIEEVMQVIGQQAQNIEQTSEQVEHLQVNGEKIAEVMVIINAIAEQTNLLALNAAIEAARAGEAGRGFAVVADEVRTLAARTHESTDQIQQTVSELHNNIQQTVKSMREASEHTRRSVSEAQEAGETLRAINATMDGIKTMNIHIASATEQQSASIEELNHNLSQLVSLGHNTQQEADQMAQRGEQLNLSAQKLGELINRFKVNSSA